jgi:hypothetical protein
MEENEKGETLRQTCEGIMGQSKAVAYAVALRDYETGFRFAINAERNLDHLAKLMMRKKRPQGL